jgi:ech hydrogenase subunit F
MALFSLSKLIAKSAVSKPATRLYPFDKREPFPKTRGRIELEIGSCVFCTLCAKKCPTEAIVCDRKDKTWSIDHLKCILCGNCVDSCRKGCLTQRIRPAPPMLINEIEHYQADMLTPKEVDAKLAAKDKKPSEKDDCCPKEEA